MSLLDSLPHTVTHRRQKHSRDEYMGVITTTETLATGVRAWVQNAGQREVEQYQKRDQSISHKVFYSEEPSIRPGDEIEVTAGPSFIGKTFYFESLADRSAGLGRLFAVMVNEQNNVPANFDD